MPITPQTVLRESVTVSNTFFRSMDQLLANREEMSLLKCVQFWTGLGVLNTLSAFLRVV